VTHGQMMGTYLSFPLLCLHSYCAALWASRDSELKGVLVNGDDTLMSHDSPMGSYPPGYELNKLKTVVSKDLAELNSTLFIRGCRGWSEVHHLRRGAEVSDFKGVLHLATACRKAGPLWVDAFIRSRIGRKWRFLPSQLGLPLWQHSCWSRQTRMNRSHSDLPEPAVLEDSRFVLQRDEPDPVQKYAFHKALFEGGRKVGDGSVWSPSLSKVLRSYPKPVKRWKSLSFEKRRKVHELMTVPKKRLWSVCVDGPDCSRFAPAAVEEDGFLSCPLATLWW